MARRDPRSPCPPPYLAAVERGDVVGLRQALVRGGFPPAGTLLDSSKTVAYHAWGADCSPPVRLAMLRLLVEHGAVDPRRGADADALACMGVSGDDLETVAALAGVGFSLDVPVAHGMTLLHRAAMSWDARRVGALLALGASADAPPSRDCLPHGITTLRRTMRDLGSMLNAYGGGTLDVHRAEDWGTRGLRGVVIALLGAGADPTVVPRGWLACVAAETVDIAAERAAAGDRGAAACLVGVTAAVGAIRRRAAWWRRRHVLAHLRRLGGGEAP